MSDHTIDTALARRMVEASAIRGASIIGQPGGWSVMLKLGMTEKPLGTQGKSLAGGSNGIGASQNKLSGPAS